MTEGCGLKHGSNGIDCVSIPADHLAEIFGCQSQFHDDAVVFFAFIQDNSLRMIRKGLYKVFY
jgi:hypothetical protein